MDSDTDFRYCKHIGTRYRNSDTIFRRSPTSWSTPHRGRVGFHETRLCQKSATSENGRPVSLNPTENISGWVENILKPLVRHTPSYIQDTTDILCKLSALGPLPEDTLLATMDVESLYSNIPHEDGIAACKYFLQENNLATEPTLQFIRFVLHHNYFSFGNNLYQQCMGSAMGSKMSPQYANLFMAKLEEEFLSSCSVKPFAYFRYIDDLLIIWTGSKDDLLTFHNNFNKYHQPSSSPSTFQRPKYTFLT
ncbi:unnamed protein product [Ranitomeya imitator]|uniref:Reverse transcriptase domain-containing protein n=1 Tax=Ranitomeya imitator TaxID=111125 RepID=A0ABN9KX83_9NEOB|nr:unnamed protein product [Ranitomeya imitator]